MRPRDLDAESLPRSLLWRMYRRGEIERIGRGLYATQGGIGDQVSSVALVARRIPAGRVCLLSALQFHGLTTQSPFEVWVAVDVKARRPVISWPLVRIVRFSGAALVEGVEEHVIDQVPVLVYVPAKTVADCFKYRNKIGLDVALEALRDAWRQRVVTMDDLWHYARVCRVANVMRPYLESLG